MICSDNSQRAAFLITLDTEGDNLWLHGKPITTENARFLPRFQSLCERFGLKATYLTNWEMANSPVFTEFAADAIARGTAEVGMHLHAWNSPPIVPLTADDNLHHPYLIEFPRSVLRQKVQVMTDCLEDVFGVKMVSHRAGRWAFNAEYAQALIDCSYRVDCTVTPHVSWKQYLGAPDGSGGSEYLNFPEHAYFLDLSDLSKPGNSPLLEVPVTVTTPLFRGIMPASARLLSMTCKFGRRVARHFYPSHARLTPNGNNRRLMLGILDAAVQDKRDHVEFMIHSSELMPGGSPRFATEPSIERLYDDLEVIFEKARRHFVGMTLGEYYTRVSTQCPASSEARRPSQGSGSSSQEVIYANA